jgi:hypothetical protein
MKLAVAQSDDALGMVQQWLEQLHHLADHADMEEVSALLAQANVLVADVRAKLDLTLDTIDGETGGPNVSVELV